MFCLGCGTELRPHAEVCALCGRSVATMTGALRVHVDRGPSADLGGDLSSTRAVLSPQPAPAPVPALAVAPSIGYGDVQVIGIPRDTAGRVVLVVSLALAADLHAPWVAFDGAHLAPALFALPTLCLTLLLLLAAGAVLYAPLRQRPAYAAFPVALGAAAAGAAGILVLMLGPLSAIITQRFAAHVLADPSINRYLTVNPTTYPTLDVAPDTGLYVFLLGALALMVAGYHVFVSTGVAAASSLAAHAHEGVRTGPTALHTSDATDQKTDQNGGSAGTTSALPPGAHQQPLPVETSVTLPRSGSALAPTAMVLPGTAGWHQPPDHPTLGRAGMGPRGRSH